MQRFPCLRLAYDALKAGGTAPTVLNAANEVAVASFLSGALGFNQIPVLIEVVLSEIPCGPVSGLEDVLVADRAARARADSWLLAKGVASAGPLRQSAIP